MAVSRSGEIGVIDANGRERERYKIPYGAMILVKDGDDVKPGDVPHWLYRAVDRAYAKYAREEAGA